MQLAKAFWMVEELTLSQLITLWNHQLYYCLKHLEEGCLGGHVLTGLVESLAEAPWQVAPGTNEVLMRIRFALGSFLRSQQKSLVFDLRSDKKKSRSPGLVDHLRSLLEASLEICQI